MNESIENEMGYAKIEGPNIHKIITKTKVYLGREVETKDPTITDDYWEEKVQHIRDDFCYHLGEDGCVDVDELAYYHGHCVYEMVKKYL